MRHDTPGTPTAYLEFALVVLVIGLVAALALRYLKPLQAAAESAQAQTRAHQAQVITSINEARGRSPPCSLAPAAASHVSLSCP